MLRVGVWGVGTWGEKHARIWRSLAKDVELVGVFDQRPERAAEVASHYDCKAFPSAEAMLRRNWRHHQDQFVTILGEMITIGNPSELSAIAAKRKSSMLLLPYGIPIAIGTIIYFLWEGLLL